MPSLESFVWRLNKLKKAEGYATLPRSPSLAHICCSQEIALIAKIYMYARIFSLIIRKSTRAQCADMELRVLVGSLLLLAGNCVAVLPTLTQVHSKFEYKYSFKGPYLINSKGEVPFWSHGGSENVSLQCLE